MSKIDFRDGALTGRLGGMVGSIWKGITYVRKMVKPANPKTADQVGVRTVFAALVEFGRRINSGVLKPYIIPTPKRMSQFNEFISRNQAMIDSKVFTRLDIIIGTGSLYSPGITNMTADSALNRVDINYATTKQGEALDTDKVVLVAHNEDQDLFGMADTDTRVDGTTHCDLQGTAGETCNCYMFMVQGDTLSSETDSLSADWADV